MKQSKLSKFKQFEISKGQSGNQKGGIFCEIYIGYTEAQGSSINNGQMNKGILLDNILATQGMSAALQQGGQNYINKYS
ncbi:MAG: hypothetical protein AB8G11_24875 [Saprospiraceae bacterium]